MEIKIEVENAEKEIKQFDYRIVIRCAHTATLHKADCFEELTQDFDRPIPPRLRQLSRR